MSEENLPQPVQTAWDAYRDMGESKSIYFSYLSEIDLKYKSGGTPTFAENLQLEKLLKAHDEKVAKFNDTMRAIEDKEHRELLLKKLSSD